MKKMIAGLLGPLLLGACASAPAPEQTSLPWDPQVVRGELANGLEYRLVQDNSQPGRLDLRLTVRAGSVNEDDDQVGVAHMLEHLTFRSRAGQAQTLREQMTTLGWVQGRHYNAVTNYDRTQYLLSPPKGSAQAPRALEKLAQLVFAGDYTTAELERERPIVIEEWRGGLGVAQRMNDQRTASQRVGSRYPKHRTIGNETAIREASWAALQRFQQRWYIPNNMILSVVGDFDPQVLKEQVKQAFGTASAQPLPSHEQRELLLDPHLKIFRLQDPQTGNNQVSLLFRLHEPDSRGTTPHAIRERLLDRMTLAALLQHLREQPLEPGVHSLTAQKSLIGERSSVVGVAAGVEGSAHDAALRQLLTELERLRQHGFSEASLLREGARIRNLGKKVLSKNEPRTFEKWVTSLNDAAVQDRSVIATHAIAGRYLEVLDSIDLEALNARMRLWLGSPDQVLQFTAPGKSPLHVPSVEEVKHLQQSITAVSLPAPAPMISKPAAAAIATFTPPLPGQPGSVLARRQFAAEKVEHWSLSNGDRLVWLRRNAEGNQWRLQADSGAGYNLAGTASWRSQMAAQLGSQSGPEGITASALNDWRTQMGVTLNLEQSATRLQLGITGKASSDALVAMMQSYRLSQSADAIDETLFTDAQADLLKRQGAGLGDIRSTTASVQRQLHYGEDHWPQPDEGDLQSLQVEELTADWQRMIASPVTYYLMADVAPELLQTVVSEQLANIARHTSSQNPVSARAVVQQPGQRQADVAVALEPRAVLEASSFSEQAWSPEAAVQVAALRDLANQQLKHHLRGEASGVYRITFDSELNPDSQRIESRLRFTCDPARSDELWALAQQTLAQLNKAVNAKWVTEAHADLRRQERKRLNDPETQWRRLLLSDRHWGDPRYLTTQTTLPDALRIESLKSLAKALFPPRNQVLLRVLPNDDEKAQAL